MHLNVIPYPAVVDHVGPELYKLPVASLVTVDSEVLLPKAEYLQHALKQRFDADIVVCNCDTGHQLQSQGSIAVKLQLDQQAQSLQQFRWPKEAYELVCDSSGVRITASTPTGVFYGIQTLLQALSTTPGGLGMPHTRVLDGPRFLWRGVLLDVGRHFFSVEFIKKVLDVMAFYKMNRFHWHLTEDQGWRLDVPSLPRLAEVAAWRGTPPASSTNSSTDSQQECQEQQQQQEHTGQPGPPASQLSAAERSKAVLGRTATAAAAYHGGCYSMDDVAAVVAYAAERCIEVVPEIELPGHCCAALAAYPNLSCTNDVTAVSTQWGIHEDVYCAGNDDVFRFLEVVFDQVASQFPCEYVHVGGDEVPKTRWEACDKCQHRITQEGLRDECELQSWFVRRVSKMLADRGRKLIGWDEILEGGLAEGATVMSWRGVLGGVVAARAGHDVIMTPTSHCYFDYKQAPSNDEPGAWYACLPLHVVYHYDPVPHTRQDTTAAAAAEPMQQDSSSMGADTGGSHIDESMHQQEDSHGTAAAAQASSEEPLQQQQLTCSSTAEVQAAERESSSSRGSDVSSARSSVADGHAGGAVLTETEALHVLGSQANLWCEYIQDEDTAEYMLLPRLAALAEAVWTPVAEKNWQQFLDRLEDHLPLLDKLGYTYRPVSRA